MYTIAGTELTQPSGSGKYQNGNPILHSYNEEKKKSEEYLTP